MLPSVTLESMQRLLLYVLISHDVERPEGTFQRAALSAASRMHDDVVHSSFVSAQLEAWQAIGSGSALEPQAPLTGRLLIDCMGHFSPIVRQVGAFQRDTVSTAYSRLMTDLACLS